MDNANDKSTPDDNDIPTTVTLNPSQYFRFQTHQLAINSPDGRHLGYFSKAQQSETTEDNFFRLREQVALVRCLLCDTTEGVTLSISGALGLADLLLKVENFLHKQIS